MPHGDYTGNQKAQLAAAFAQQQQLAATQMSLVNQVVKEANAEPIDLMPMYEHMKPMELVTDDESGETIEIDSDDPTGLWEPRTFRSKYTLESITVGKDATFTLEEGFNYIVPTWVYVHLDEQDLVWH